MTTLLHEVAHGRQLHRAYTQLLADQRLVTDPSALRQRLAHLMATNPHDTQEERSRALQVLRGVPDHQLVEVTRRAQEVAHRYTLRALEHVAQEAS